MGLDMYIDKCRKPKIVNGKREYEEREEVCYWRKFWGLLQEGLPFKYGNEEYGQDIRLSKDDVEQILNYVTHNKDYFYDNIGKWLKDKYNLSEAAYMLREFQDYLTKEEGYIICFNANW